MSILKTIPESGHDSVQYTQLPSPGTWSSFSSTFVEHQCLPSGSVSVMQPSFNLPWNLNGMAQGVSLVGLSLVVTHFGPETSISNRNT